LNADWRTRYDALVAAAQQAGAHALRYFDTNLPVEWKHDHSPVTVADREAEELLRKTLTATFPQDGFLGEEYGDAPGKSGYRWIIDPIDGTRNYVRNIPLWATLVGLEFRGEAIAGAVVIPPLNQTFRALRGDGAYRNDRRLHVSDVAELGKATLFYTSLRFYERVGRLQAFLDLAGRCQNQRGYGDFYGHVLLAQGSGELMVEHGVHIWDIAAIQPIVEEAGGRLTTWDGKVDLTRPDVLVSNGHLHEAAQQVLQATKG
jgi:histidinol-phosphatase